MAALLRLIAVLLGLFLFFSTPAFSCDSRDRAALLDIRAGFQTPSKFSTWNLSASCCTWYAVDCKPIDDVPRVTSLFFYNYGGPLDGLSGQLPDALGDLQYLSTLILGNHPNIYGTLPLALNRLQSLTILSLTGTSLSGHIPSFLTQIPSLIILNLSYNKYNGFIPPELATLPSLRSLILRGNGLEGTIPAAFVNFNKSARPSLFLSHNELSGEVPAELGVPNWQTIDLSHNKLRGDAKFLFGAKKRTKFINLSFNQFGFDISNVSFPITLTTLALNMNRITGSIPAQINMLRGLVNFNVSDNDLCGIIPAGPVMDSFHDSHFFPNKCLRRSTRD